MKRLILFIALTLAFSGSVVSATGSHDHKPKKCGETYPCKPVKRCEYNRELKATDELCVPPVTPEPTPAPAPAPAPVPIPEPAPAPQVLSAATAEPLPEVQSEAEFQGK